MTPSELKYQVELTGKLPHFFTRKTMKFFGDTMANYGVRSLAVPHTGGRVTECWELYRKSPVGEHRLTQSHYFLKSDFSILYPWTEYDNDI
jgi:hypothetical protein